MAGRAMKGSSGPARRTAGRAATSASAAAFTPGGPGAGAAASAAWAVVGVADNAAAASAIVVTAANRLAQPGRSMCRSPLLTSQWIGSSNGRSTRFQPGPRRCWAPTVLGRCRRVRTPAERPNRAVRDAGRVRIPTLGPRAVDGRPVRGTRLAAAVRELVGARGRAVSTAALTQAVWTDDPPEDSPGALQSLMSRVLLLGVPVLGVPGGYRVLADQVT